MAQKFQTYQYTADSALVFKIRMSNEVAAITGNSAQGTYDDSHVEVSVSKHGQRRRVGIAARGFVAGLPAIAPAIGYTQKTFIPILNPTLWNTLKAAGTVGYKGDDWTIITDVGEV